MSKKRHVYALFDSREHAAAAFAQVQARGCSGEHCSVLVHRDHVDDEELPMGETAAREGAKKGAFIIGATGALLAGLVALPGALLGLGPLAAALFGAGTGAIYGGVFGAISGASEPDQSLRKLEAELEAGKILVAVETDDEDIQNMCSEVFAVNGGVDVG